MMNHIKKTILPVLCLFIVFGCCLTCRKKAETPINVILFISDGCGYSQVDAASLFQYGRTGKQIYEKFPIRFAMSTYPANGIVYDPEKAWASFDYVKRGATDSAASATAMATGVKTYNGAINVDMQKKPLKTFFETAEERGKSTGIVSSVHFSHATGACFAAHNARRSNYVEIAREMILHSAVDVIMGCGHPRYSRQGKLMKSSRYRFVGGRDSWNSLLEGTAGGDADNDGKPDPWTMIQTREEFQTLASGPTPKRVLGLPQVYQTLQQQRGGDREAAPFEVPFIETVPTLTEMILAALNVLDNNPEGFYLMVEGGAVDWASHDHQSGRVIEEQIDFNRAIEAAVKWIEKHSNWNNTLIIVTGDHETGYLTGPGSGEMDPAGGADPLDTWKPLENRGKNVQPGMEWHVGGHTNSLIPFFAKGADSQNFKAYADEKDPIRGLYLDNTEIAQVIFSFLDNE
jgi:alkaline phosphatase